MVFCNKCGKENNDSTKFCTGCGENLLTSDQTVLHQEKMPLNVKISHEITCIQCGKQNKENAKFCIICGNNLALSVQQDSRQDEIPPTEILSNELQCTKCGKQNKSSTKFCIVCGNSLNASKQEPEQKTEIEIKELEIKKDSEIDMVNQTVEFSTEITESINVEKDIVVKYSEQGEDGNTAPTTIIKEDYPKRKRKKIILLIIGSIVVASGLGAFFIFANIPGKSKDSSLSTNQQVILPKEGPKVDVGNISQRSDSAIPNASSIDTAITISPEIISLKSSDSLTASPVKNTNKVIPVETPEPPTLQMAINDLTGQGISKDLVFTKNAKVLSYAISKKTIQQCNVIIAFKLENSDVKYTATLVYKNIAGSYVYENNTSQFKTSNAKEKDMSSQLSTSEHTVKNDLINYLKAKKIFGGIKYNDISEIVITKVNNKEYYAESGNTSYQVELTINNLNSKCQVNYTIDGKFYVNPLRY